MMVDASYTYSDLCHFLALEALSQIILQHYMSSSCECFLTLIRITVQKMYDKIHCNNVRGAVTLF